MNIKQSIIPEIGMGVTLQVGSDSYPLTIVAIRKDGAEIDIQFDDYKRTDSNGISESQSYIYMPNILAVISTYTLRKSGRYILKGQSRSNPISIGYRRAYWDPSF